MHKETRHLALPDIKNLRDMGGYKGTDNRTIRWGALYRSGFLTDLGDESGAIINDRNISTVIDFRSDREKEHRPVRWPNNWSPTYHANPIGGNAAAWVKELFEKLATTPFPAKELHDQFILAFETIPIENASGLKRVFDILIDEHGEGAALFHCTAGKDRTGITGALIMTALGCHKDDIYADFMLTNAAVDLEASSKELTEWASKKAGREIDEEAVLPLIGVKESFLDAAFTKMADEFGSVDQYLNKGMGLNAARIERLRDRFLE